MGKEKKGVSNHYSAIVPRPILYRPEQKISYYRYKIPQKVQVLEYFMKAKNNQRVYSYSDQVEEYRKVEMPPSEEVSYMNLFINGVLQPLRNYEVKQDNLILNTMDLPLPNTTLILQMIKL